MKISPWKIPVLFVPAAALLAFSCSRGCQKGSVSEKEDPDPRHKAVNWPDAWQSPTDEKKDPDAVKQAGFTGESMASFASSEEFDTYASSLADKTKGPTGAIGMVDEMEDGAAAAPPTAGAKAEAKSSADSAGAAGESITNVQEAGVDEGDIVKLYGDYLVVLRRGRMFTIHVRDQGKEMLTPVSRIDAYPKGFTQGSWYDEMLIYKDKIIIIGYSYAMNATEIGTFLIDDEGRLRHQSTHFMDSNDYYSSRNYTSRLVGGTLVFYMPYYMFTWDYSGSVQKTVVKLPGLRKWIKDNEVTDGKPILGKTDIYKPVQETLYPTLHVVVRCDLDRPDLECNSKAVLGPYSRTFYVSTNAVYVWVAPEYYYTPVSGQKDDKPKPVAHLYRIGLIKDSAQALQAYGAPIDQFSFKEDPDGYLNVVVRETGAGDAMWNPEFTGGKLALIRTSLRSFSSDPRLLSARDYTMLPTPTGYTLQNRFAGQFLVYGTGSGWYHDPTQEKKVFILSTREPSRVKEIEISHGVDRIEVMGDGAVVIGGDSNDLHFSAFELHGGGELTDTYTLKGAMQGELRSHGFFYKATSADEGVLGLPVRRQGQSWQHLISDSAEVVFLHVSPGKKFSELGALQSKGAGMVNDNCVASCVDWYGNARPIFLGNRILALMGYELVEGTVAAGKIKEVRRTNFFVKP